MKEKVVCGNLYQLADSVRLATPLARFGKVVRTASKQGVASSSLAGRATSLETHSIQRSNRDHSSPVASPPIICFFDRWSETAGLSRFSFFFCRSNCLRELNPIRYPLRIRSCHRNVIHAEHAKRALGKSYSFKLTFANAPSVPVWLVIRPKLPTTPSRQ